MSDATVAGSIESSRHYGPVRALFDVPFTSVAATHRERADFVVLSTASGVPTLHHWTGTELRPIGPSDVPVLGPAALHASKPWVVFGRDTDGDENHHVLLADLAADTVRPVTERPIGRIQALHWTQRDQLIAVGNDLDTVFVRRIGLDGTMQDLLTSDQHMLSSSYDPRRRVLVVSVGRGAGTRLAMVDALKGGVVHWLAEAKTSEDRRPAVHPERGLLAYTVDNVSPYQQLLIREMEGYDDYGRYEVPGEVEEMVWLDRDTLLAAVTAYGHTALRTLNTDDAEWSEPIDEGHAAALGVTLEGPVWTASCFACPPGVHARRGRHVVPLLGSAPRAAVTVESHWYMSADTHRVQGWLLRNPEPRAPLVVYVHGGPELHLANAWLPPLLALVQAGYHVFAPNYRGSTSFGSDFRRLLLGDVGGGDLADVQAGARFATQLLGLDTLPAIIGDCYGGFLALLALSRQSESWAGGVALVPPVDMKAAYEMGDAHYRQLIAHLFGGTPHQRPDLYLERSPATYVAGLRRPVLIIHGENDARCPLEAVVRFAGEAEALGLPVRLHVNPAEGHGSVREDLAVADLVRMLDHLDGVFGC